MTEALDVVTFGETMVCFAAHEPGPLEAAATFTKIVAGAESNVAVGLSDTGAHNSKRYRRYGYYYCTFSYRTLFFQKNRSLLR